MTTSKLRFLNFMLTTTRREASKRGLQRFGIGARNRRKSIRYNCLVPVEIHQDTPGQVSIMNAVAQNISSGGMLVKCSAVLDSLNPCYVMFKMPEWFPGANRARTVMNYAHVQRAEPSRQNYGIAFKTPL
jgi:PilZ domain